MKGPRDVNVRRRGAPPGGAYWAFGINAVARRLAVRPETVRELRVLPGAADRRGQIAATARAAGIAVRDTDARQLAALTGSDGHQGVAALVGPFAFADLADVRDVDAGPLLLLDQLQDPQNLGALIRTAAAAGMAAVVITRHRAATITGAVEKVAAGAIHDVPICQVTNLHRTLLDLRAAGYWSIALTPHGGTSLFELELPERPALVLGGETGLRSLVEDSCDFRASIPQRRGVESLNASVAGAVAMYDVARRRNRLDSFQ